MPPGTSPARPSASGETGWRCGRIPRRRHSPSPTGVGAPRPSPRNGTRGSAPIRRRTGYRRPWHRRPDVDVTELTAIDVHTHAEVGRDGHRALSDELLSASEAYFKAYGHRRPTIDETAAHY